MLLSVRRGCALVVRNRSRMGKLNDLHRKAEAVFEFGSVAQLVEHHLDMVVVVGSSPIGATIVEKTLKD